MFEATIGFGFSRADQSVHSNENVEFVLLHEPNSALLKFCHYRQLSIYSSSIAKYSQGLWLPLELRLFLAPLVGIVGFVRLVVMSLHCAYVWIGIE